MKTIASLFVVLSLFAGVATPVSAAGGYNTQGGFDAGQSSPL